MALKLYMATAVDCEIQFKNVSNKIAAFIKKLSFLKEDIASMSGSSQYFPYLSYFLERKV